MRPENSLLTCSTAYSEITYNYHSFALIDLSDYNTNLVANRYPLAILKLGQLNLKSLELNTMS